VRWLIGLGLLPLLLCGGMCLGGTVVAVLVGIGLRRAEPSNAKRAEEARAAEGAEV
jgi:hypothetical protein